MSLLFEPKFVSVTNSSFVPPKSTKDNTQVWYKQGYEIMDAIVDVRKALINQIKQTVLNEVDFLEKQWKTIEVVFQQTLLKFHFDLLGKSSSKSNL